MLDIAPPLSASVTERTAARDRFDAIRQQTEALAANLTPEDQAIQSMPDVSPTKWHLAHTTWFFETFLLAPFDARLPGLRSGLRLSVQLLLRGGRAASSAPGARPVVAPDRRYRRRLSRSCHRGDGAPDRDRRRRRRGARSRRWSNSGLNHEQQHQELILMDIKHVFSSNPLLARLSGAAPACRARARVRRRGSSSPAGSRRSVIRATGSLSTTRGRGTRSGSNRSASHRGR